MDHLYGFSRRESVGRRRLRWRKEGREEGGRRNSLRSRFRLLSRYHHFSARKRERERGGDKQSTTRSSPPQRLRSLTDWLSWGEVSWDLSSSARPDARLFHLDTSRYLSSSASQNENTAALRVQLARFEFSRRHADEIPGQVVLCVHAALPILNRRAFRHILLRSAISRWRV